MAPEPTVVPGSQPDAGDAFDQVSVQPPATRCPPPLTSPPVPDDSTTLAALKDVVRAFCEARDCMADLAERITVNPKQYGGRPCVRGLRIRVVDVLDLLAAGLTPEEVLGELPDREAEDVRDCLRYASRRLDHPILAA